MEEGEGVERWFAPPRPESFALSYSNLWNKLLDPEMSQVLAINMPPYRRVGKGKGVGHKKAK